MATKIPYVDETWNPIKMFCTPVSEGCANCYARRQIGRNLPNMSKYPKEGQQPIFDAKELKKPLHWKKPRKIFVCSMGDLFHPSIPAWMIDLVFDLIMYDGISHHTFIILTKRLGRLIDYLKYLDGQKVPPNVWLGVTAENQRTADERIPILLQIPADVHFVSIEPMLGSIDLRYIKTGIPPGNYINSLTGARYWMEHNVMDVKKLDWVICGGETGRGTRPLQNWWVGQIISQCKYADIPFYFKGWGSAYYDLNGYEPTPAEEMPRQWPKL